MIDLHESMGPGQDQTHDPWICNQTLQTALHGPADGILVRFLKNEYQINPFHSDGFSNAYSENKYGIANLYFLK